MQHRTAKNAHPQITIFELQKDIRKKERIFRGLQPFLRALKRAMLRIAIMIIITTTTRIRRMLVLDAFVEAVDEGVLVAVGDGEWEADGDGAGVGLAVDVGVAVGDVTGGNIEVGTGVGDDDGVVVGVGIGLKASAVMLVTIWFL